MLRIYYHRDFDGMASAAILAEALEETGREPQVAWAGVNFDRKLKWSSFGVGERFAVVDFHFHPRAEYWFDHHPTTFLSEEDRRAYKPNERRYFDAESPSCPPIILAHAAEHWGWDPPDRFHDIAYWSNIIDAATFDSVDQALFGLDPALRIMRALTCAPDFSFHDRVVALMRHMTLIDIAADNEVDRCFQRSERNRDNALENFSANVVDRTPITVMADLRSKKIRRERFAAFYLYPELNYAVTVIPTRGGTHITVASNPWNRPMNGPHLGNLLKEYGGGGHQGIGGVNPPDDPTALRWAREIFEALPTEP